MPRLPSLLLCAACGDSLLGDGVDRVFGADVPDESALEWRWYLGPDEGTLVGCELMPVVALDAAFLGDQAVVQLPDWPEPPRLHEGAGWGYALGQPLLVDARAPRATADEPLGGVWGLAELQLVLVAEGDLGAVTEALQIVPGKPDAEVVEGPQWVWSVLRQESWERPLASVSRDVDDAVVLTPRNAATALPLSMATGEGPGGIQFEACP